MKVSASILSANLLNIADELKLLERSCADYIHFDVMDGQFVSNITFGANLLYQMQSITRIPFDVHLMVHNPTLQIEKFAKAGADIITIHVEASESLESDLKLIRSFGKKAGVTMRPNTNIEFLKNILHLLDVILVMTVEPGEGGQGFMYSQIAKINDIRKIIDDSQMNILLQVDGGINAETGAICLESGVDIMVAGSYLFKNKDDFAKNMKLLKNL